VRELPVADASDRDHMIVCLEEPATTSCPPARRMIRPISGNHSARLRGS
jgi:hypothetical protein